MPYDEFKSVLDRATLATDLVKHISTLASGSIVVLATFLTRVGGQGQSNVHLDKTTLVGTVALLLACILCCSAYLLFFGMRKTWTAQHAGSGQQQSSAHEKWLSVLIFLTFFGGVVFLGLYAVKSFGVGH